MHSRFLVALLLGAMSVQGRVFEAHGYNAEKDVDTATLNNLDDSFEFMGFNPSERKEELYDMSADPEPAKRRDTGRRSRAEPDTDTTPRSQREEPEAGVATRQDDVGWCRDLRTDIGYNICINLPYKHSVAVVGAGLGVVYVFWTSRNARAVVLAYLRRFWQSRHTLGGAKPGR